MFDESKMRFNICCLTTFLFCLSLTKVVSLVRHMIFFWCETNETNNYLQPCTTTTTPSAADIVVVGIISCIIILHGNVLI